MKLIFDQFWIFFIIVTIINGFIFKYRSKKYIVENPTLEKGYDNFFKGWLFYANIPWIIIGLGNLSGITNNITEYFYPRLMNPFVLAFHASIIVLYIILIRWIYFKKGAEFIEEHPGFLQRSSIRGSTNVTAKQIKIFLPLMLLGGVIAIITMWTREIPPIVF